MNRGVFHAMTRRASLIAIGTVGLAALTHPITTDARKKRRKNKGKKGDVNKLCKRQVGQCIDVSAPDCDDNPECLTDVERCCSLLGTCDFDGAFACFETLDAARNLIIRPRSTR